MRAAKFKWVVEFTIDPSWVADGFDLTKERAIDMLATDLMYANPKTELGARIIKAPNKADIRKAQGYDN